MPDVISHLRDSGFNDDEIGAWAKTTRENLTASGFKDEEVDDYLGLPKTPKGIPAAFVERMVTGAKIAAQISNLPKAYVDLAQGGYHIGQEAGQETLDALKGVRDKLLPKEFGGQRDIEQEAQTDVKKAMEGPGLGGLGLRTPTGLGDTGAGLFGAATLPFAPLQGVIHAVAGSPIIAAEHTMRAGAVSLYGEDKVRQAEEAAGLTPGGMSKENANKIIDTALMGMGNKPVQRIAMGPGGVPELQQIGGLPKGEDFSNASTMIGHGDTTPVMEGKLADLYEQKGIHPAEVAHDAQTDVTITQSLLSVDKQDMPAAYVQAYHGSPHDFAAFSSERIGTGEGAQSYGHGLYFAEARATAESYREALVNSTVNGAKYNPENPIHYAAGLIAEYKTPEAARAELQNRIARDPADDFLNRVGSALRNPEKLPEVNESSNLYQVRIHADREAMLDWDKPLSEQSESIQQAMRKLGVTDMSKTGEDAHFQLAKEIWGKPETSQQLHDAGIPGIKYLDQGSRRLSDAEIHDEIASIKADAEKAQKFGQRAAPQALGPSDAKAAIARLEAQLGQPETRNFVVFNDKDVEITHKNGEPVTGPERAQAMDILNERQPSSGRFIISDADADGVQLLRPVGNARSEGVNTTGIHFSVEPEGILVKGSYLPESARGRGTGFAMYEELARIGAEKQLPVFSDYDISAAAKGVYEKLKDAGHNVVFAPGLHEGSADGFPGKFIPGPNDSFTVRIDPPPAGAVIGENARDILNERQPTSGGAAAVKPPAYSDAQQQVLSKISIDEKAPTAKLTWDKLYTNTMDKLFPLAKAVKASGETLAAEENPYQLARLLSGSAGKADHFLNNGTFDFTTYENNGASMREILAPVKDDLNGFRAYMASARALELEGRGIKSGFDAGEAPSAPPLISAGLDAPRTVVIEGRDKFAKPLLDLVDYQNRVAAYARDAGVISDAGYKAMTQANQLYVPFSRVMGLDEGSFIRGGGSSLQAKNPVKSIKGSARDIIDPLESIIRNTHLMVEMAERNVVGTKLVDMLKRMEDEMPELPKATADVPVVDTARAEAMAKELAETDPTLDKMKPGSNMTYAEDLAFSLDHATAPLKEGEIAILRDGKRETYGVDPDLANAMKGLNSESAHWMVNLLSAPANLLRQGAVLTPQFWARHIMRDYLYATATSTAERGLFTPWDMAKGLSGLIMKDADYWDWMKSGGSNTAVASMNRQYLQENLRELTGKTGLAGRAWNVVADPNASMWQSTKSTTGSMQPSIASAVGTLPFKAIQKFVIDPLRAATEIAENASHLAAFKKGMRAQEAAEPEATNLRDQIIRAGWASRDTAVDAARMGASMRAYNQIFAFGNIKLQDTDRVVRAFKDNPITASVLVAGAITVPAVTLWAINHDDPDYQELPQWEKDMFFIVPVGTAEPSPLHVAQGQARGVAPTNSAAMFLRLPKPWAMGMIFGSGVERMLEAYKGTNPTPFKEFGKDLYATSGPDFVPTAAAPIIDQFANRSTFTNRTLIPAAQEKFLPEYQYTPYTTELTKELGKVIGAFPGISQAKMENSGVGGVAKALTSPILMENYIRGWTGTLGMYTLQLADKALRSTGTLPDPPKPASTLADIPVIQAFVVRYPGANTESVQTFQDDYAKAQSFMTTWQAMAKDGNVQAMQHIQDMADTHMLEQLDGFHQAIGNLNQMVRLVYKNPDIPADEKRQLIDQLYYGIIQTAQGGNHAIHAIREKAADVVSTRH